jgi:hypothetical protein
MPPAARAGDMHICPLVSGVVPHVGGPVMPPGVPTVLIGGMPAGGYVYMHRPARFDCNGFSNGTDRRETSGPYGRFNCPWWLYCSRLFYSNDRRLVNGLLNVSFLFIHNTRSVASDGVAGGALPALAAVFC